jgi:hypothetical protein
MAWIRSVGDDVHTETLHARSAATAEPASSAPIAARSEWSVCERHAGPCRWPLSSLSRASLARSMYCHRVSWASGRGSSAASVLEIPVNISDRPGGAARRCRRKSDADWNNNNNKITVV